MATEAASAKLFDLVSGFQEAARRGDWNRAGKLMAELRREPAPADRDELADYLGRLYHALAIARASRSAAAGTLNRIRAAAHFSRGREESPRKRQNIVDLTSY